MASEDPLFIHGWWRSSSTYLWSKFRDAEGFVALKEPFHEGFRGPLDARLNFALTNHNEIIALNHPRLEDQSYFTEYVPLIRRGLPGVSLHDVYRRYAVSSDADLADLGSYLDRLIDEAGGDGKAPVLVFARSMGKIGWMASNFDGKHILLIRHPASIWKSMMQLTYLEDIDYFFSRTFQVISHSSHSVYPGTFGIDVPKVTHPDPEKENAFLKSALSSISPADMYRVFVQSYTSFILRGLPFVDAVIELDRPWSSIAAQLKERQLDLGTLQAEELFADLKLDEPPHNNFLDRSTIAGAKESFDHIDRLDVDREKVLASLRDFRSDSGFLEALNQIVDEL